MEEIFFGTAYEVATRLNVERLQAIAERDRLRAEVEHLRTAIYKSTDELEQTLGKALGYPEYDETVMPGGNPEGAVCVGPNVPESLASEAADLIGRLRAEVA